MRAGFYAFQVLFALVLFRPTARAAPIVVDHDFVVLDGSSEQFHLQMIFNAQSNFRLPQFNLVRRYRDRRGRERTESIARPHQVEVQNDFLEQRGSFLAMSFWTKFTGNLNEKTELSHIVLDVGRGKVYVLVGDVQKEGVVLRRLWKTYRLVPHVPEVRGRNWIQRLCNYFYS